MGTNWEMRVTPMEIIGIMQGSMLGPFQILRRGHVWPTLPVIDGLVSLRVANEDPGVLSD